MLISSFVFQSVGKRLWCLQPADNDCSMGTWDSPCLPELKEKAGAPTQMESWVVSNKGGQGS